MDRKRQFPHVDGNWAAHVYLRWPHSCAVDEDLGDALRAMKAALESSCDQEPPRCVVVPAEVHVSLSRTVVLQLHAVETYVAALSKEVARHLPFVLQWRRELAVLTNETQSCAFVAVQLARGARDVDALIDAVDRVGAAFQLPLYFAQRRLHATLLSWAIPRPPSAPFGPHIGPQEQGCTANVLSMVARQQAVVAHMAIDHSRVVDTEHVSPGVDRAQALYAALCLDGDVTCARIAMVTCRVGNKIYELPLKIDASLKIDAPGLDAVIADGWLEAMSDKYTTMEMYELTQPARAIYATDDWLVTAGCLHAGVSEIAVFQLPWHDFASASDVSYTPDLQIIWGGLSESPVVDLFCTPHSKHEDSPTVITAHGDIGLNVWRSVDGGDLLTVAQNLPLRRAPVKLLSASPAESCFAAALSSTGMHWFQNAGALVECAYSRTVAGAEALVAAAWRDQGDGRGVCVAASLAGALTLHDSRAPGPPAALCQLPFRHGELVADVAMYGPTHTLFAVSVDTSVCAIDLRAPQLMLVRWPGVPESVPASGSASASASASAPCCDMSAVTVQVDPYLPSRVAVAGGRLPDVVIVDMTADREPATPSTEFAHTGHAGKHILSHIWHPICPGMLLSTDCAAQLHAFIPLKS